MSLSQTEREQLLADLQAAVRPMAHHFRPDLRHTAQTLQQGGRSTGEQIAGQVLTNLLDLLDEYAIPHARWTQEGPASEWTVTVAGKPTWPRE